LSTGEFHFLGEGFINEMLGSSRYYIHLLSTDKGLVSKINAAYKYCVLAFSNIVLLKLKQTKNQKQPVRFHEKASNKGLKTVKVNFQSPSNFLLLV
jgi:hypothetical protein